MSANLRTASGIISLLKSKKSKEEQWKELEEVHPHCTLAAYEDAVEGYDSLNPSPDFIRHFFNVQTSTRLLKLLLAKDYAAITKEFTEAPGDYKCRISRLGVDMDQMEFAKQTSDELTEIITLFDETKKLTIEFYVPPYQVNVVATVLSAIASTKAAGRFGVRFLVPEDDHIPAYEEDECSRILDLIELGYLFRFADNCDGAANWWDYSRLMTAIGSPAAPKGFELVMQTDSRNFDYDVCNPFQDVLTSLTTMIRLGRCPSGLKLTLDGQFEISDGMRNGFFQALSMDSSEPRLQLFIKNNSKADDLLLIPSLKTKLRSSQLATLSVTKSKLKSFVLNTIIQVCPDDFVLNLSQNRLPYFQLEALWNQLISPNAPKYFSLNLNETTVLQDSEFPATLVKLLKSPHLPLGLRLDINLKHDLEVYRTAVPHFRAQYDAMVQALHLQHTPPGFKLGIAVWFLKDKGKQMSEALESNSGAHRAAALSAFIFLCCQFRLRENNKTYIPKDIQYLIILLSLPNWWRLSNNAPKTYPEMIKTLSFFTPKKGTILVSNAEEAEQGREKRAKTEFGV